MSTERIDALQEGLARIDRSIRKLEEQRAALLAGRRASFGQWSHLPPPPPEFWEPELSEREARLVGLLQALVDVEAARKTSDERHSAEAQALRDDRAYILEEMQRTLDALKRRG